MTADPDNDLLLIIAASGKQATQVLRYLPQFRRLRLTCRSSSSRGILTARYPYAEVIQADVDDAEACKSLFDDVTICFFVTPGFSTRNETVAGYNIIDAASRNISSGGPLKHIVYSSVLHPCLQKLVNHDCKRYVEEYLIESGLPYTIVQPTHMMETTDLVALFRSKKELVLTKSFSLETMFSFVSARDVGEVSAKILLERGKHFYATYQLVGTPEPMDYLQVARIISEVMKEEVQIKQSTVEDGARAMSSGREAQLGHVSNAYGPARLFMYYNERGLIGNPNVLEMLLGRKPLGYSEWVALNFHEYMQYGPDSLFTLT